MSPGPATVLTVLAGGYGWGLAALAAWLDGRAGSSRKAGGRLVHVGAFTGAVPAHLLLGFWGVVTYGAMVGLVLLSTPLENEEADPAGTTGHRDALRRAWNRPGKALIPTALGGLTGAALVGTYSTVGFLVCGWGSGLGEWVGQRWGTRALIRPFARGDGQDGLGRSSIEGALGVLLCGWAGAWVALRFLGFSGGKSLGAALACGLVGALAGSLSRRGTAIFWVQVLPSLLAWGLLG